MAEDGGDLDLRSLGDEDLVQQMHDDLYDGIKPAKSFMARRQGSAAGQVPRKRLAGASNDTFVASRAPSPGKPLSLGA